MGIMARQFRPGQLQTGSLFNISSSYAITASFALNGGGGGGTFPFSGSAVITGSLYVSDGITGSLSGTASVAVTAQTASYVLNAVSSSFATSATLATTASYILNAQTASFAITAQTASYVLQAVSASYATQTLSSSYATTASYINNLGSSNYTQSFSNSSTWTFTHNLGTRFIMIQTYDSGYDEIIPQNIDLTDNNTATITFPTLETGYAVASVGGALSYYNTGTFDSSSFATTGSVTFTGNQVVSGSTRGNVTALSISSNTASIDLSVGNFFILQLVAGTNTYINPSNILPGQTSILTISTTGSATVSWSNSVKQPSGSLYIPTTTAGIDIITLASVNTASLYVVSIKNMI
jgi:hypothetical protein